jgi:hypothetical protein
LSIAVIGGTCSGVPAAAAAASASVSVCDDASARAGAAQEFELWT